MNPNRQPERPNPARSTTRRPNQAPNRSKAPTPRADFRFLRHFKTLALLAVVFVVLGSWILPQYVYIQHYRLGDPTDDFPIVAALNYGDKNHPILSHLGEFDQWKPYDKAVTFTDTSSTSDELQVELKPVTQQGQTHYRLTITAPLYTIIADYRIVDGRVQPMYMRNEGMVVWVQAFWITLALAVLILVIQIVLGLFRSATLSPEAKKRLRRHLK